jgi:uncharacterized protein (DUF1800 family)
MKIRQVSRRIAYGFSFEETMLDEDNFIKNAKQQLERLPDFNPWQYIAEFNDPGMNVDGDDLSTDLEQKTELSLDKTQKKDIQRFLKKTKLYKSAIDGDFGKGTRRAIAAWQKTNKFVETGQLTHKQYRVLLVQKQRFEPVEHMKLPRELRDFSKWNLSQADLRYPTSVKAAVIHRLELDDERERLRKLYAEGEIPESEVNRLWWQRFNAFPWWRDTMTRTLDNVYGPTPVFNRFWHFWINFFAVNVEACEGEFFGNYYLTIRSNMCGKFEDLLFDAVWHPAMQEFLQNNESTGPNSRRAKHWRRKKKNKIAAINENLAREVLELFTLTPAAGYSQEDVNGVAYILTGWGQIWDDDTDERYFSIDPHEPGNHRVLGKTYKQPASRKLRALCSDLAKNPRTASHIATKLSKHFIADDPPTEAIEFIADAYIKSKGDLVAIHQATVDAVLKFGDDYAKFLQPEIWYFQIHRAVGGYLPLGFDGKTDDQRSRQVNSTLLELGHLNCRTPQPNGWSDLAVDWLTPEMMDRRVRYVGQLANKLRREKRFDPYLYADKVFGEGSPGAQYVAGAPNYKHACIRLFCHPDFMRA